MSLVSRFGGVEGEMKTAVSLPLSLAKLASGFQGMPVEVEGLDILNNECWVRTFGGEDLCDPLEMGAG